MMEVFIGVEEAQEEYNVPKEHKYFLKSLRNREFGVQSTKTFQDQCTEDLVKHLQINYRLKDNDEPEGALNFNQNRDKIVSSLRDGRIIVWDWSKQKKLVEFRSGHMRDVKQVMFMQDNSLIASMSEVELRLADLSSSVANVGRGHTIVDFKDIGLDGAMALIPDEPKLILTVGSNPFGFDSHRIGKISVVDIREKAITKMHLLNFETYCDSNIDFNPANGFQFCLCSSRSAVNDDSCIRIFDLRFLGSQRAEVVKYCPRESKPNCLTYSVFSKSGQVVLGSYSDGYSYLFNTSHAKDAHCVMRYQGHSIFFGPDSEFVMSKSGPNMTFWSKETQMPVFKKTLSQEDCISYRFTVPEHHPYLPIMATTGLGGVNVWLPTDSTQKAAHNLD